MPPPHRVRVVPVRRREHDDGLGVDVLRTVAYRLECSCGAKARGKATVAAARAEQLEHRR